MGDHTTVVMTLTAMVRSSRFPTILIHVAWTNESSTGPELLAAVGSPQCGATIWVKNTGPYLTSVNNGIGRCIEAKLVDQEGGLSVGMPLLLRLPKILVVAFHGTDAKESWADLNPAAWTALTDSPDGQVTVEWYVDLNKE